MAILDAITAYKAKECKRFWETIENMARDKRQAREPDFIPVLNYPRPSSNSILRSQCL